MAQLSYWGVLFDQEKSARAPMAAQNIPLRLLQNMVIFADKFKKIIILSAENLNERNS